MSLVEGDQIPVEQALRANLWNVLNRLVSGHTDIKLTGLHQLFQDLRALLLPRVEIDNSKLGRPAPELLHPVRNGALRGNDQVWSVADQLRLP